MARIVPAVCLSLGGCGGVSSNAVLQGRPNLSPWPTTNDDRGAGFDAAPHFSRTLIPTDAERYPYNHVATIAEPTPGELIVAWGAGSRELGEDTAIVMSRRAAGGRAWSTPVVVADRPDHADANPALFVDGAGSLWLFHVEMFGRTFCLGRVKTRTSDDGGHTWSEPRTALPAFCVMVRNKPIVTRSGRWVLPAYIESIYASQFWYSDDAGRTWRPTVPLLTVPDNNLQPTVAELADGSLLAYMRRSGDAGFTWEGRSTDGGLTWKLERRPDLPNPNSGLDMVRLRTGELVLAYNDSPTERTPLVVAVSTDDGATWSRPKTIEAGEPQLSYPSIIEASDGMIHVVYTHRGTAIGHAEFNRAWLLEESDTP